MLILCWLLLLRYQSFQALSKLDSLFIVLLELFLELQALLKARRFVECICLQDELDILPVNLDVHSLLEILNILQMFLEVLDTR